MIGFGHIRRCADLTAVSRLVERDRRYAMAMRRLRKTRTNEQHFVLSAPATAALAIDESGIAFPDGRPLRIALLATGTWEFLDDGQWFRFLPAMLGCKGSIQVCAFNRDPESARTTTTASILNRQFDISTYWTEASLSESDMDSDFDIAMSFAGLTGGDQLLKDLKVLGDTNTPLVLTSFSSTHALLSHAVLRAHGANATPILSRNPFGLVTKRAGENWNRVISKVQASAMPTADAQVDEEYLGSLQIAAAMVYQSHQLGDPSQTWAVGGCVAPDLVHTLDGIAVNTETREVIDLNAQRILGALSQRFAEVVQEYSEDWDETDKLIWASSVRYLAMAEGMTGASDHGGAAA